MALDPADVVSLSALTELPFGSLDDNVNVPGFTSGAIGLDRIKLSSFADYVVKVRQAFSAAGVGPSARTILAKAQEIVSDRDYPTLQTCFDRAAGGVLIITQDNVNAVAMQAAANTTILGWGGSISVSAVEQNGIECLGDNVRVLGLEISGPTSAVDPISPVKNVGVFANGFKNIVVDGCTIHGFTMGSVQLRACNNYRLTGNLCYDNNWNFPNAAGVTSADISIYSGVPSARGIIAHNFCFSDNSHGIGADINEADTEITISGNVCVSLTAWAETPAATMSRRHGIQVHYAGVGGGGRIVVIGNVCRNTLVSGIYTGQAGSAAALLPILIEGNVCSRNGFANPGYFAGSDATLAGGITCIGGNENLTINGNMVHDFQGSIASEVGAITLVAAYDIGGTITNNTVSGSTADGICLKGTVGATTVRNNKIMGVARYAFSATMAGGLCGFQFDDNTILMAQATYPAVYWDDITATAGFRRNYFRRNRVFGFNKATATATNSAFYHQGNGKFTFQGNHCEKVNYGFLQALSFTGRKLDDYIIQQNHFFDLNVGMRLGGTNATALALTEGNTFDTVTRRYDAVGYLDCVVEGYRLGDRIVFGVILGGYGWYDGIMSLSGAAALQQGTLVRGDSMEALDCAAAGVPPGYKCTTAGGVGVAVIKAHAVLV